jgi:hypothetical protein
MKAKFFILVITMIYFSTTSYGQFYVKGGVLVNQLGSELRDLDIYKGKASYNLGIGNEILLLKVLVLDAGVNFMNIKQEIKGSDQLSGNSVLAFPFQIKIRPVPLIDFGAGLMPSFSISRDKALFEKSVDISGVLSGNVNISPSFSIEAAYYAGFIPYNEIDILDTSGGLVKKLENRLHFYTLGVKFKF